ICPTCLGRAQRLALLRHGVGCAKCCQIKWGSERGSKIARLVRRIDEIAGALELRQFRCAGFEELSRYAQPSASFQSLTFQQTITRCRLLTRASFGVRYLIAVVLGAVAFPLYYISFRDTAKRLSQGATRSLLKNCRKVDVGAIAS